MHDDRPVAEAGGELLLVDAGDVADEADVERDRGIEALGQRERPRAVQAVLLLDGGAEPELAGEVLGAEQRVHQREPDAVVHARPDQQLADAPGRGREHDGRADVQAGGQHRLAVAEPELHPEVVVGELVLLALLDGQHVTGAGDDHALEPGAVARERLDRLADGMTALGACAAVALGAVEEQVAVLGHVADDVADLVHVRLDQHPRPAAADARDEVADRVAPHLGALPAPAALQEVGEI